MRFLQSFFRRSKAREFTRGRGWTIQVVGESNFQEHLRRLYKAHSATEHDVKIIATLVPENDNRIDPDAIKVEIRSQIVGYLSRQLAAEYRKSVGEESGHCSAKIVGGFLLEDGTRASFGVKLNLSWPPRFR